MRRGALVGVVVAVAVAVVGAAVLVLRDDSGGSPTLEIVEPDGSVEHSYVIPAGTAERRTAGETIDIMPTTIEATVGDTIQVRNDDDVGAFAGIFYVGPGESASMSFTTPGTLSGECQVSASGEFTVEVSAA